MGYRRKKSPFSLQKRPANKLEAAKKKEGKRYRYIYYCQFRDENDKYMTAISTGETNKAAAEEWAYQAIDDGSFSRQKLTFKAFSEGWWNQETCAYCIEKSRTGRSLSLGHIRNSKRNLTNNILPYFQDYELSEMTFKDIRNWMNQLYEDDMNPASINRNLATLKPMMKEALRTGLISFDPTVGVPTFAETPKQKSILTLTELNKLFDDKKLEGIWQNDIMYYCLNLLSASTGMRLGECLGLQLKYINFNESYIEVRHSYSPIQGLKDTKNHEIRLVPISRKTHKALETLVMMKEISNPDDLLFISEETDKPLDAWIVGNRLYKALDVIGISPKERKERNITFHSYRHLFNSLCRSRSVPEAKIRQAMGHKTARMTDHYSHLKAEDLHEVIEIQKELF